MRAVIQRVKQASVEVKGQTVGKISQGLLVFLGIGKEDSKQQADSLAQKIVELRVFEDGMGKMNISALESQLGILVVSQFTLYGDCSKGRRPSFDKAAGPLQAEKLYEYFVAKMRVYGLRVETGRFRATMDVQLINDGPVTFILSQE